MPSASHHLFTTIQQPLLPLLLLLISNFLTLPTRTLAANSSYPPCIDTCIANNPSNSWCSGDETGRVMEECVCRGLDGLPMIRCIAGCEPEEQWAFAGGLPGACRERVFPNATESIEEGIAVGRVGGGEGVLGGVVVVVGWSVGLGILLGGVL
ncbi:hypothetical protein BJX64DRAFT_294128 [Aspergillus heterothallicus]